MIAAANDMNGRLAAYLAASYAAAAVAMAPFAGDFGEMLAFGACVWVVPAILAFAFRKRSGEAARFGYSALCLLGIVALAWVAGLGFQAHY